MSARDSVCSDTGETAASGGVSSGYPKITVLVCTLDEEPNLPHFLPRIPGWVNEVLLVDGHSSDRTVEVARKLRPDIRVLYQPGRGKGDALKYGVEHAAGSIIVTLDADGQTDPEDTPRFIEPLLNGYDLAKGSRLAHGRPQGVIRYRWLGNKVLALTCNLLYGTRFTDVCSGFNCFRREQFLKLNLSPRKGEPGCSMEQQMIVRARKAGMRIKEVPHRTAGRTVGQSAIGGFRRAMKQGFTDLSVIIRERFRD